MKICLLVSGHLRTFKSCLPSQKKLLVDELGCDVFFHSWKDIESKTTSWHNNHMTNRQVDDSDISFIKKVLEPKLMAFEDQVEFGINNNLYNSKISLNGLKNMTYGFKRAKELMNQYQEETGKKYDLIVKIRPDIMLHKSFSKNILNLKNNSILFFGNQVPITEHVGEKKYYHNFRALDILSVCTNDDASQGVYGLFDNFEDYYGKKQWHHSPYLDFVIDKKIAFNISLKYLYGSSWSIKRSSK